MWVSLYYALKQNTLKGFIPFKPQEIACIGPIPLHGTGVTRLYSPLLVFLWGKSSKIVPGT